MSIALAPADIRNAILNSAEHLLAGYGFKRMTMDDLALEAGIGKGTTYLHFPSKEEVVLCTIDRIVERLLTQLREIAAVDAPPAEKVRQMLARRVLYRFDSVKDYSQGLDDVLRAVRPAYLARQERYLAAEAEIIADVLRAGRDAGAFACIDPLVSAHTLLMATSSLLPYSLSRRELGKRKFVEEQVGSIAELLLEGLKSRS